jgi:ribonuclease H / adenosylcobalamin/alpha-ribazole phosphatase
MRLFILARHGESHLNVAGLVNGDPARDPGLTESGESQARALGRQISALAVDLAVTSRFPRAQATARLALAGRDVPHLVVSDLDDVRVGELEGCTIAEYRAWKSANVRGEAFPGGESLAAAAARFAAGFNSLLRRSEEVVLVVCHEIPVRYAINAAAGSSTLDSPVHDIAHAQPYVFDEHGLAAAVMGIERLSPSESAR